MCIFQFTSGLKVKKKLLLLLIFFWSAVQAQQDQSTTKLKFILEYETLQSVKFKDGLLFISPEKLTGITDSIPAYISTSELDDTIFINYPWKFPLHAYLILTTSNEKMTSNKFYLDPARKNYIITVSDSSINIKPQPRFSFDEKKSFMGIILVIQISLELLLAILFYKIFNWPKWIVIAVLVANLAALSVYLLKFQSAYLTELGVIVVKFLMLLFLGRRKLGLIKIIGLLMLFSVISFGFKKLLVLLTQLI